MRSQELAELGAGRCLAKAPDQLALVVDDADPRAEIRDVVADRGGGADLTDIKNRLVPVGHAQPARAMEILPLRLVFAVTVEHLDAVVLAVGDVDPAIGVAA